MARVTVEDCLEHVESQFHLVLVAAQRAKQQLRGARPLVAADNREVVTALQEIAAGKIKVVDPVEPAASDKPSPPAEPRS